MAYYWMEIIDLVYEPIQYHSVAVHCLAAILFDFTFALIIYINGLFRIRAVERGKYLKLILDSWNFCIFSQKMILVFAGKKYCVSETFL